MLALFLACRSPSPLEPIRAGAGVGGPGDDTALRDDSGEPDVETGETGQGTETGVDPAPAPVVVIGGGPAGLATAMDLSGVVLFEASDELGGRAPGAGQLMWFVGTEEQEALGVVDSPELALSDWPTFTGAEPTWATEAFVREADEVHDRLVELGLAFVLSGPEPVLGRQRNHGAMEPGLPAVLQAALPDDVDLRLGTTVTGLLFEDGRVVGVRTDAGEVAAEVVVIASGGFAGRADLLAEHSRWEAGRWRPSEDGGARGDALDWARGSGLGTAELSSMGFLAEAMGLPGSDGLAVDIYEAGSNEWIFVNQDGQRFTREDQVFSLLVAGHIGEQEEAWQLMARERIEERLPAGEEAVLEGVVCGEDWSAVATGVGVTPEGLEDTLTHLNSRERSFLAGIPCAFPPGFVAAKGFGGLAVDEQQRVLDLEGEPVEGLYAVGEAAGMAVPGLGGHYGFDGSLSAVVWSGWRAAAAIEAARVARGDGAP